MFLVCLSVRVYGGVMFLVCLSVRVYMRAIAKVFFDRLSVDF